MTALRITAAAVRPGLALCHGRCGLVRFFRRVRWRGRRYLPPLTNASAVRSAAIRSPAAKEAAWRFPGAARTRDTTYSRAGSRPGYCAGCRSRTSCLPPGQKHEAASPFGEAASCATTRRLLERPAQTQGDRDHVRGLV